MAAAAPADAVWQWNPLAIPALLLGPVGLICAWIVFRVRPQAIQNRAMAATLLVTAITIVVGYGVRPLTEDRTAAYALYATYRFGASFIWLAWYFVAASYPQSWSRALIRPALAWPAVVLALTAAVLNLVQPDLFFHRFTYVDGVSTWAGSGFGPLFWIIVVASIAGPAVALVGASQASRRARTGLLRARYQTLVQATAFGLAAFGLPLAYIMLSTVAEVPGGNLVNLVVWPAMLVVFSVLAAYGFAKEQSLRAELRSRSFVRRGTLAAIGLPALVITFQVGTEVLNETLGLVAGATVMAIMLAFAVPLQRWVDRASESMAPGAGRRTTIRPDDDPYWQDRKRRIFAAALDGALADGVITDRERTMLQNLQLELGIANEDARRMEKEMAAR